MCKPRSDLKSGSGSAIQESPGQRLLLLWPKEQLSQSSPVGRHQGMVIACAGGRIPQCEREPRRKKGCQAPLHFHRQVFETAFVDTANTATEISPGESLL